MHVGVGEDCAASGPARKKTTMASITGRIAAVQVRTKPFISRRDRISDRGCSRQAPDYSGERTRHACWRSRLGFVNFCLSFSCGKRQLPHESFTLQSHVRVKGEDAPP